jgi:predicted HTH transcriptional regulator
MKIAELKRLLKAGEWNDVEFKEARLAAPKSAFETVSAFANTHGGWLVFGVSQRGEKFEISGPGKRLISLSLIWIRKWTWPRI